VWWPLLSKKLNHLNATFDSSPISWRPSMSQGRQLSCHTNSHFPCWFILDYVWRRRCKDRTKNSATKKTFRWRTISSFIKEACYTTKTINPLVICILNIRCVWKEFRHTRMNSMEFKRLIPDTLYSATIREKNLQKIGRKNTTTNWKYETILWNLATQNALKKSLCKNLK
jgi:hypothetical protein